MRDDVLEMTAELAEELAAGDRKRIIDPRSVPVRFSRLKAFARSALHYYHAVQVDGGKRTAATVVGSGAHAVILEQPYALWTGKVRRGKAWNEFLAENRGVPIMNEREFRISRGMADAVAKHPVAWHLLFGDTARIERHLDWSWLGRACSSRPDSIAPGRVTELKTTASAEPGEFVRHALRMHYPAQLAFYQEAARSKGMRDVNDGYIVAVEQEPPHAVTVFQVTAEALDMGARLCRGWMERLLVCEQSNEWPAYTTAVVPLDVPSDDGGFRLVIDGEDLEL